MPKVCFLHWKDRGGGARGQLGMHLNIFILMQNHHPVMGQITLLLTKITRFQYISMCWLFGGVFWVARVQQNQCSVWWSVTTVWTLLLVWKLSPPWWWYQWNITCHQWFASATVMPSWLKSFILQLLNYSRLLRTIKGTVTNNLPNSSVLRTYRVVKILCTCPFGLHFHYSIRDL